LSSYANNTHSAKCLINVAVEFGIPREPVFAIPEPHEISLSAFFVSPQKKEEADGGIDSWENYTHNKIK
jgi:hypothetical protein